MQVIDKTINYYNPEITITDEAKDYLVHMANGEVRIIINMLEAIFFVLDNNEITLELAKEFVQRPSVSID